MNQAQMKDNKEERVFYRRGFTEGISKVTKNHITFSKIGHFTLIIQYIEHYIMAIADWMSIECMSGYIQIMCSDFQVEHCNTNLFTNRKIGHKWCSSSKTIDFYYTYTGYTEHRVQLYRVVPSLVSGVFQSHVSCQQSQNVAGF